MAARECVAGTSVGGRPHAAPRRTTEYRCAAPSEHVPVGPASICSDLVNMRQPPICGDSEHPRWWCASRKPGQLWKPFRPIASALFRPRRESVVNGFIEHRVNDGVVGRLWSSNPAHQVAGLDCQNGWLTIEGVRRHAARSDSGDLPPAGVQQSLPSLATERSWG